jgi:hypothetical protein
MQQLFPILATASSFDLIRSCDGSVTLRQVRDPPSAGAVTGTSSHAATLRPGALPPPVREWFGDADPSFEVAIGADCASGAAAYFGRDIARAYPLQSSPTWIAGTADMIRLDGRVLSVGDLKTGWGQSRGDLCVPEESGQLLGLAWLACRLMRSRKAGWAPDRVRLMWWYTASGAAGDIEDAEVAWPYLREWGEDLETLVCKAWSRRGAEVLQRGPHCGGCGSRDACPAMGGAVARVASIAAGTIVADYGAAFQDLLAAERACELARAAISAEVESAGPLPCGDHAVRLVRGSDSRIDIVQAEKLLGADFGRCVDVRISQGSVERGLGEGAAAALEKLRAGGAIVQQPKAPYLRMGRVRRGGGGE